MEARQMVRRTIGVLCLGLAWLVPGVATAQTEQVYYYHEDAVGSVRMVTDASGQEATPRYDYWPFGQVSGTPSLDPRMFGGKEHDAESGLEYFGARYYAGGTGRFMTVDPVMTSAHLTNPQTFNRYAYALNNPLKYVDPDGRDVSQECIADKNCTIELRVNIIYDRRHPLTPEQKAATQKAYLEKAQADFNHSKIEIAYTYTEGRLSVNGGKVSVEGARSDMLNAVFTTGREHSVHAGSTSPSGETVFVNVAHPDATERNVLLMSNTFEHEMGHAMRGGTPGFFSNVAEDWAIDSLLLRQTFGMSVPSFRQGLEHKVYAVEAHPATRIPKQ